MISALISRLVLLVFGTLYPAYASYKTVKTKNVRDYVRWMMYWIVFAAYTFVEMFTDIFIAFWFPFYYELKIVFVVWLVFPATDGSSYIFRKAINPYLSRHEVVIDGYIAALWSHGYDIVRKIGAQGMDYLIDIMLDLLRKGRISMTTLMPQIEQVAQSISVPQSDNSANENVPAIIPSDEDFVIMNENSESEEIYHAASSKPSQSVDESASEMSSDAAEQNTKRTTRSKKKTLTSIPRERKKTTK